MITNPLVSIIVRTKDRPNLLVRALKSIASQTYRPIEVVLVNDGGCDLDIGEIKQILRDVSVNYIRLETNTGRAHAGNVGIENAKGEYIGFLDDDDEFYPEHVETLITYLNQTGYKVAYTDTEMVTQKFSTEEDKTVETERVVFSRDFSFYELLIANYIPFTSLLFSSLVLKSIGGLDETFDLYEDWDLLIRVASENPFFHVKGITVRYNQWSLEHQINRSNPDYMRKMHIRIMEKHRDKIPVEYILNIWQESCEKGIIISEKEAQIRELDSIISKKNEEISGLDERLKEKDALIRVLEGTIHLMRSTLGWRVLERFRSMRERYLPEGTDRRRFYNSLLRFLTSNLREKTP